MKVLENYYSAAGNGAIVIKKLNIIESLHYKNTIIKNYVHVAIKSIWDCKRTEVLKVSCFIFGFLEGLNFHFSGFYLATIKILFVSHI